MAIVKNIKINVDTSDAKKAEEQLKKMAVSAEEADSKADIRVDVDSTQIDTAKIGLDQMGTSLDTASNKALRTSTSLKRVGDNGGAIAVLDRLTGGLATQMRDAFEATKLFNFSLKGTRTALIATGIGVFIVALGVVVAYWDDIVEFIGQANKNLERQLHLNNLNSAAVEGEIGLLDKQIKLLEKQGKSTEVLVGQKRELVIRAKELNQEEILGLEIQLERLKNTQAELGLWEKIKGATLTALFGAAGAARATNELVDNRLEALTALEALIKKAKGEAIDLDSILFDIDNPQSSKTTSVDGSKSIDTTISDNQKKLEEEIRFLEQLNAIRQGFADKNREDELEQNELDRERKLLELEEIKLDEVFKREAIREINEFFDSEDARIKEENRKKEVEADKKADGEKAASAERLKNAKIQLGMQTLTALSALAKEGSDLAKGVAAAQAIMSTYQSAVSSYNSLSGIPIVGPVLGGIAAGLAVVTGLANVKKILAQKPIATSAPSGAGGGGSVPQAPSFNLVEGSATNQIADSVTQGTRPVKAFVVSSDVTDNQEMDRNIEDNSSI